MKVLSEKEEFLKNTIRDIIAINPLTSIRRMQELVEQRTQRPISDKYVSKLMRKIRRGAIVQSDRTKLNERLAEVRERYRVLILDLNKMIYWRNEHGIKRPTTRERLSAIRLVAQLDLALFKAELDAGMYEDRRGAIEEMLKQGLLPTELREQVVAVFRTWKFEQKQDSHPLCVDSK